MAHFTKTGLEAIAAVINDLSPAPHNHPVEKDDLILRFVGMLQYHNPDFNADIFRAACNGHKPPKRTP